MDIIRQLLDGMSCLSLRVLGVAFRRPRELPGYVSETVKRYDELVGVGLPGRGVLTPAENLTVTLPAFHAGGGMSFAELMMLARITRALRPAAVFEMGTYNGLSTAVFLLNSDPSVQLFTLDLPVNAVGSEGFLPGDSELIADRCLASVPRALELKHYTQLYCDSMKFDPSPYLNSIDIGLVDAAHDVAHARNDTAKMATMMRDSGVILWHDYGGRGALRPLARYLDSLGKRAALYRIPGTSLAWSTGAEVKKAMRP